MIVRALNVTVTKASMPNTVNQAMRSGAENIAVDDVVFCCWERLVICEMKENGY